MTQYGVAMYAVFQSGGKQHRVTEGQTVRLEKLELEVGSTVEFDNVLMIANGDDINVGAPYIDGGKVVAEVVTQGRADKVKIVKFLKFFFPIKKKNLISPTSKKCIIEFSLSSI